MEYIKKFFKLMIWPISFYIGQILIITIFSAILKIINNNITVEDITDKYIIIPYIIIFVIYAIIFTKKYKNNNIKENKLSITKILLLIMIGILFITIYNITVSKINQIILFTTFDTSNINIIQYILLTTIIGPILEELLFRGIIFNELKKFNPQMKSILITSFLFSIMHTTILQIIYAFALSFMLIYVYQKYKTIFAPIIMHITSNLFNLLSCILITNLNQNILTIILVICLITIYLINKKIIKKDLK